MLKHWMAAGLRAAVAKALESLNPHDLGGLPASFGPLGPHNPDGSRFVELPVIGSSGKLLK